MHKPTPGHQSPVPRYSLVRLSATSTNLDWYETNCPESDVQSCQWADWVSKRLTRVVSRLTAITEVSSDSGSEDSEIEAMDEEDATYLRVYPRRFRLWDLASSPGGGSTAVLLSKHRTQHAQRRGKSILLFGWHEPSGDNPSQKPDLQRNLTTEGQLWEWMYGGGSEVPGTGSGNMQSSSNIFSPLRELLGHLFAEQTCVFCDAHLERTVDNDAACPNGHSFGKPAASVPISHVPAD